MSITDIQKMTTNERLEAMEHLWDSLTHDSQSVKSPEWHEEALKARREHIESGEAKFYTLEQVKSHFKNK